MQNLNFMVVNSTYCQLLLDGYMIDTEYISEYEKSFKTNLKLFLRVCKVLDATVA
jgi:hypothetical protein